MNGPIPAGGEAMPKGPNPEYCAAWEKCRDLGKQLSQALADTGDQEYAFVRPAGVDFAVLFGLRAEDVSAASYVGTAVDRVERLTGQLAVALDEWNAQTNTPMMVHIPPASSEKTIWFENTARHADLPQGHEAVKRLNALLGEAGRIIRDNPDLAIDTININDHGVHTFYIVPDVPRIGEAL